MLDTAGRLVADLEQRWRQHLPTGDFDAACRALNNLLIALDSEQTDDKKPAIRVSIAAAKERRPKRDNQEQELHSP